VIDDESAAAWSEAKNRAERDAQIVVRAVVEIDFVADVEAQADRPEMTLQSSARIEHTVDVVGAEAVDATEESSESGGSGFDTEIDEATFQRDKWLDGVMTDVNFGAKFSVENAQMGARKRDRTGAGIGEPFRERLVEVVARLSFQLYFLINLKTGQGADATEIVVGLRQAEIVGKNTQFHVVPVLRGSERYQATCQKK
jgi:hypothetical protein